MQYFIINKHKMTTNDNEYDDKSVVLLILRKQEKRMNKILDSPEFVRGGIP